MQDQYVNHIMSETGATVLLRGRRSGNSENALGEGRLLSCITFELCYLDVLIALIAVNISIASALLAEAPQPLHLLLSSNDPIGLERAKLLAENLLDTISAECGASR